MIHDNIILHLKWEFYQIKETWCHWDPTFCKYIPQEESSACGNARDKICCWHRPAEYSCQASETCWLCADCCAVRQELLLPKILHPVMNIHNVQVMLSAHHLCIFLSDLQRQLNKTLLKADKSWRHMPLIRLNKSSSKGCDHVRDYFRVFTPKIGLSLRCVTLWLQACNEDLWVSDLKVKSPVGGCQIVGVNHCL